MPDIIQEQRGPILSLRLNRPDRLNAFSEEMLVGLKAALSGAATDEGVRVVVLSGEGRAFSAGGDVKTMGDVTPETVYQHIGLLNETILAMTQLEKPVVAAVHGVAAGAGFNLALASDLIVAASDARFIMSFVQVGLISDGGGLALLPRLVGPAVAKELFFLGEPLSAERAYQLGVVNRLAAEADLAETVEDLAMRLAQGPRFAMAQTKRLVELSTRASLMDMLKQEQITQSVLVGTSDHQEGVRAFLEKRRPRFMGEVN